jgi:hypothetical protein
MDGAGLLRRLDRYARSGSFITARSLLMALVVRYGSILLDGTGLEAWLAHGHRVLVWTYGSIAWNGSDP